MKFVIHKGDEYTPANRDTAFMGLLESPQDGPVVYVLDDLVDEDGFCRGMIVNRLFALALGEAVPTLAPVVVHVQNWNAGEDKFYRVWHRGVCDRQVNSASQAMAVACSLLGGDK